MTKGRAPCRPATPRSPLTSTQIPRALPCPAATAPLVVWASTVIQLLPPPYLPPYSIHSALAMVSVAVNQLLPVGGG